MENTSTKKPDDYVIATGVQYSIKEFINMTAKKLNIKIIWKGNGLNEKGLDHRGNTIIECDKNYFRPLDVNTLRKLKKSKKKIKMETNYKHKNLISEMIELSIKF